MKQNMLSFRYFTLDEYQVSITTTCDYACGDNKHKGTTTKLLKYVDKRKYHFIYMYSIYPK